MSKTEFLHAVEDLLEVEAGTLKLSDRLDSVNWDSLAVLGFISMVDQSFGIQVQPVAIGRCVNVEDLYRMVMACATRSRS